MEIGISTAASGAATTLVASERPPRPVSSNTMSALVRVKARNAAAVVISKNVIGSFLLARSHSSIRSISACSPINAPARRMRS